MDATFVIKNIIYLQIWIIPQRIITEKISAICDGFAEIQRQLVKKLILSEITIKIQMLSLKSIALS